jgi:hypothetical protein
MYDIGTGTFIHTTRISVDTVFITVPHKSGFIGINQEGLVSIYCVV